MRRGSATSIQDKLKMNIINALFQVVFNGCVQFLLWLGDLTELGYVGVNVVIFCIIWPAVTIWLVWKVMKLKRSLKRW